MPALSWPEIRSRATRFAKEWQDATSERAEAQTFWNEFFDVFGVNRRRVAVYEKQVAKLPAEGKTANGRIDVFWPATMLAEHKSAGADLTAAFEQAINYFAGLKDAELPRYVVVSDFQRFRFYDLEDKTNVEFKLSELSNRISLFGFIAGYSKVQIRDEDPLNIKAVELLKPKAVVPIHYNTFPPIRVEPDRLEWWREAVRAAGSEPSVLSPGESMTV